MSDTFVVPAALVERARDYWDAHRTPELRDPAPGERCYYIGWSPRQEAYVLLSEDTDEDDNTAEASQAYHQLIQLVPTRFVADGEVVGTLGTGFWDIEGNDTTEITLPELWFATLLQASLDEAGRGVCLRMTSGFARYALFEAHADTARFEIAEKSRAGFFKRMAVRNVILDYIGQYFSRTGRLPSGVHTLSSGVEVVFPGEAS